MQNVLYSASITTGEDAPDGETGAALWVTEEVNAYIVWYSDYNTADTILKHFGRYSHGCLANDKSRNAAIEFAVQEKTRRIPSAL